MHYKYPVKLTPDDGTFMVTFYDVPEAITFGSTKAYALMHAVECLEAALSFYTESNKALPKPSKRRGPTVEPTLTYRLKLALYEEMRSQNVRQSELARRIGMPRQNVQRLFDPAHKSRIDVLESAFKALKVSPQFDLVNA